MHAPTQTTNVHHRRHAGTHQPPTAPVGPAAGRRPEHASGDARRQAPAASPRLLATTAPTGQLPAALARLLAPRRYRRRFALLYTLLALVVAASATGFALLTGARAPAVHAAWSSWRPATGSITAMIDAIAFHTEHEYRLSPHGYQLVAVIAKSPPVVLEGTSRVLVANIGTRTRHGGIQILDTAGTVTYTLCGLGPDCSIATGQSTPVRRRLVRREALQLALYTLKYVPSDAVVVFLPPAVGQPPALALFFQKQALTGQLQRPLTDTLPLREPPPASSPDTAEARTIDALTLGRVYVYHITPIQTGGAILILDKLSP